MNYSHTNVRHFHYRKNLYEWYIYREDFFRAYGLQLSEYAQKYYTTILHF